MKKGGGGNWVVRMLLAGNKQKTAECHEDKVI